MATLQETLSRKLGPLPVGVWILAVGGGLGLSYYLQRPEGEGEESDDGTVEYDEYGYDPFTALPYSGEVGLVDYGTQSPISQPPQAIISNEQWIALGADYLIGIGNNPLKSHNALVRYTNGESLDTAQQALVSQVIRHLGSPPEGVPSVDPGDIEVPTDPGDNIPRIVWHPSVPQAVRTRFAPDQIHNALSSLRIPKIGRRVGEWDIRRGLRKLGWSDAKDLKVNQANVIRLLNFTRAPKPKRKHTNPVWHPQVPSWVKRKYNANQVHKALFSLGVRAGTKVGVGEIKAGLRKLGYKKNKNLRLTTTNINRLLRKRKARKGE